MADEEYIVLEDITGGLELPNIMDIKIGARTWGLDANDKKIQTEEASYPGTKKPFGFSILGLILHPIRGTSDEMTKYDKKLGKALKTEEIQTMPKLFFDFDNSGLIKDLVELVIERLEQILDVYDRQRKYLAFASSVLFVYDVKVVRQFLQNGDRDQLAKAVRVKLIDFAHTFHSGGVKDDNFVGGIRSLIQVFRDYVEISSNETKNPN